MYIAVNIPFLCRISMRYLRQIAVSVSGNHQGESSESAHTQVENDEIGQKSVLEGVSFYQDPFCIPLLFCMLQKIKG